MNPLKIVGIAAGTVLLMLLVWHHAPNPERLSVVKVDTIEQAYENASADTDIVLLGEPLVGWTNTGSMRPYIIPKLSMWSYDLTSWESLQVNDAITFIQGDRLVVHFVHEKLPDGGIITKGSGNQGIDPWVVQKGDFIGKVKTVFTARRAK